MPITINGGFVLTGGMSMGNLVGALSSPSSIGALQFTAANQSNLEIVYSSNQPTLPPPYISDLYTGDITIELWVNPTGASTSPLWWVPTWAGTGPGVGTNTSRNSLQCRLDGTTLTLENIPVALQPTRPTGASVFTPITTTLTVDSWNYVCVTVVDSTILLYVNGSLVGSSTIATTMGALSFNAAQQNSIQCGFVVPPDGQTDQYTGNITIETWIKPTGNSNSSVWNFQTDEDQYEPSNFRYGSFQLLLNGSALTVQNLLFDTKVSQSQPSGTGFTPITATVNLNAWNHVCVGVINGVVLLYVNGSLAGTATAHTYTWDANLTLGATVYTFDNPVYYDGLITEFRISNTDVYNIGSAPATMSVPKAQLVNVHDVTMMSLTMIGTTISSTSGIGGVPSQPYSGYVPGYYETPQGRPAPAKIATASPYLAYMYASAFFIGWGAPTGGSNTYYDGLITNFRISSSDVYGLKSAPSTMSVPTAKLTATPGNTLVLLTMDTAQTAFDETSGNPGGDFVTPDTGPTSAVWVLSTPGPY
jgi:hypothetical protein